MAEIRSFRGLYYNPARVSNLADVIALPYDVISPDRKKEYLKQNPWNIVRLILPDGEDRYDAASRMLDGWMQEEVLVRDDIPSIYCYQQTFRGAGGDERTRKGFIALVRLEDFDRRVVLPHESTLSAPKEDRLQLLRATRSNFSPILGLYSDPEGQIDALLDPLTSGPARAKAEEEGGIAGAMWAIQVPEVIDQVAALMKDHWVLIADGHHRYESCLAYRNERMRDNQDPDAPFHFSLMFFSNIHQPGIAISPYNRGVHDLPKYDPDALLRRASRFFDTREFEEWDPAIFALGRDGAERTAFLALLQGKKAVYLFRLKHSVKPAELYPPETPEVLQKLDVNLFHKLMIEHVLGISDHEVREETFLKYYKDQKEELREYQAGRLQIAFFLNPAKIDQIVSVARAGETMPPKSTYFHPKLMTGWILNRQEGPA
jgi:uncharacterized protein (DUF1015 family)